MVRSPLESTNLNYQHTKSMTGLKPAKVDEILNRKHKNVVVLTPLDQEPPELPQTLLKNSESAKAVIPQLQGKAGGPNLGNPFKYRQGGLKSQLALVTSEPSNVYQDRGEAETPTDSLPRSLVKQQQVLARKHRN